MGGVWKNSPPPPQGFWSIRVVEKADWSKWNACCPPGREMLTELRRWMIMIDFRQIPGQVNFSPGSKWVGRPLEPPSLLVEVQDCREEL